MIVQNANVESIPFKDYLADKINNNEMVLTKKFDLLKLFWIFLIGSIFGFVVETIWCFIKNGNIECRSSMIFAPLTAVYGVGALILYLGTRRFSNKTKILHIFIFGIAAGTIVEYVCSFIQEILVGSVSWDYSGQIFNIGGRVCLLYSVFWGFLSILWYIAVQPVFEKIISKIPARIYKQLTLWILAIVILDVVISIAAVARWGMRIDGISAGSIVTEIIDVLFPNEFMSKIYPNMLW